MSSRPRLVASTRRRLNSIGVRCTPAPSTDTVWAARSIRSPSAAISGSDTPGTARRSAACNRATNSRGPNGLVT